MAEEFVIDHQKVKERMSSIVRSKEGCVQLVNDILPPPLDPTLRKMVNVNARLPFNLHNKNLSVTIDASSSRGSRSASSSTTNRPSLNLSPLSPSGPLQSHEQIQGYVGAPLTPVTQPHQHQHQQQHHHSSAISRDSSMVSREPSTHESEMSTTRSPPILSVRLVKNLPSGPIGIKPRRGRARRKGGENNNNNNNNGSPMGIHYHNHNHPSSVPPDGCCGLPASDGTMGDSTARDLALGTAEIVESKPTLSVSPASTVDFILQDTGPLTVSWGD